MWRHSLRIVRKDFALQRREFKVQRREEPFTKQGNEFSIGKSIAFTIGATCTFYGGASIYKYEQRRSQQLRMHHEVTRSIWPPPGFSRGAQKAGTLRRQINDWWQQQSIGHRTFYGIAAVNALVLGLWRVPRLATVMSKYFLNSTTNVSSLLLSTFSHISPIHFICNMTVLYSFSNSITALVGPEDFVATYLSAGVIASLASRMLQAARGTAFGSVGASGAIMGILAICSTIPNAQLSIIFLPMYTFAASTAMKAVIAFDILGVALRWTFLDHAAHLGGAFFGLWLTFIGHKYIAEYRRKTLELWRTIRR